MGAATTDTTGPGPSVGVVMPAHNAAAFIDQALAGVAAQSRPPTRIIVVDDTSRDDTAERARAWADHLPITVVRLDDNVGSGEARRRAIDLLDTDLLAPLDADDVWMPDHLEHLVAVWRRTHAVVSARAEVWRPGETRVDYHRALGLRVPRTNQLAALLAGNFVFFGSVFARADYERVGGFGRHRGWEDWELWVKLVADGVPVALAEFPTVLYRRHPGNLTQDTTAFDQALVDRVESFRREHPEWLQPRQWEAVARHRRAMLHLNRATAGLRRHELGAVTELARAIGIGRGPVLAQIARQGSYRLTSGGPRFRPAP